MDHPDLILSPSVEKAVKLAGPEQLISAGGLAQIVFKLHKEYARGSAGSLILEDTPSKRKAQEWLDEVQTLFDLSRVLSSSQSEAPPQLHGRLLVVGLGLLERHLWKQLESVGAFAPLVEEIREPLPEILTERGRKLYEALETRTKPDLSDTVPNWPDDPLLRPDQDLLGRAPFARFLARRIDAIAAESGAYSMHVFGPWGAGKTSLLNFLHKELEQRKAGRKEWLVVEFNAWRHQHIQPPWWSLMEAVFKVTKRRLSSWERFEEYWWRFNSGRLKFLLGFVVMAWLLALVVFPLLRNGVVGAAGLNSYAGNAENLSKILALVATLWGGVVTFNRSLLLGSARAAQEYTELTGDPTNEIKRRFAGLINKLLPARVAILIDDLDRCQSGYVVNLLEGIQTLFREAPVVFVVAADRHWLNACYEEVYEKLQPRIHEPGKPLGTLFLEKAFRFSTPMPGLPEKLKESYWSHLLRLTPNAQTTADAATIREKARNEVTKARSESEVRGLVDSSRDRPPLEQRALREEAVVRLAAPEILQRLEHTLKPYVHLLEPNPRAMKLLVNSYSSNRALAILSEVEIGLHQLAIWTILCSRWPQLADYLADHPEMLQEIGQPWTAVFPEDLRALCTDPSVTQVIRGDSAHKALSIATLKQCTQMRS